MDELEVKVICAKCGKECVLGVDAVGEINPETQCYEDVCDTCGHVLRGLPGTPIEGFGITPDHLEHGMKWLDTETEEIGFYSDAEPRRWVGLEVQNEQ
jgi:hypothetical protein